MQSNVNAPPPHIRKMNTKKEKERYSLSQIERFHIYILYTLDTEAEAETVHVHYKYFFHTLRNIYKHMMMTYK